MSGTCPENVRKRPENTGYYPDNDWKHVRKMSRKCPETCPQHVLNMSGKCPKRAGNSQRKNNKIEEGKKTRGKRDRRYEREHERDLAKDYYKHQKELAGKKKLCDQCDGTGGVDGWLGKNECQKCGGSGKILVDEYF